jgi:hypothetical protein
MRVGDVLLLEAQTTYPTAADRVPVEVEDLVFEAIRATVARGVVVVEAGGNGAIDLDQFQDLQRYPITAFPFPTSAAVSTASPGVSISIPAVMVGLVKGSARTRLTSAALLDRVR